MIEIKSRWDGRILYTAENAQDVRAAVREAVASRANLRDANLSDADLSGAYLRRANLSGAYLRRANLGGADLSGANLSDANLRRANLRRANLGGANLSDANLRDAYLSGADLSGADLSRANLSGADLRGADLSHLNPGEALRAVEELREEIEARDASDRDKAREAESGYAQGYAASRREERRRFELLHDLLLAMESREAAAGPYGDEPPREDYAETMASLIAQARNVIGDPREMGADRDKPRDPFSSGVFVYAVDIGGEEVHLFAIRDHARAFAALFGDARVTEQPLLDGDYVDEVRADLEADRG